MELVACGLDRRFRRNTGDGNFFEAVHRVDLTLRGGEMTVLTGRSGSGKTTLMTMLAGLLPPSDGTVTLDGKDIYSLPDRELSRLRARRFAVIPQGNAALSSMTVMENILFPAALAGLEPPVRQAGTLMERLGIPHLKDVWPGELSGGELRRMSVARALAAGTDFVFADEPTADLDDENTVLTLEILKEAARTGKAVFVVTHDREAADYADVLLRMDAGKLISI